MFISLLHIVCKAVHLTLFNKAITYLLTSRVTLNSMGCGARSQCRRSSKIGVIWSSRDLPNISLAASLSTA